MRLATDNINQFERASDGCEHLMRLSRVTTTFDESNLVPNAGLLLAAVLAQRIDLAGLVDRRLNLAKHGASSGTKALTVIGSMRLFGLERGDRNALVALA